MELLVRIAVLLDEGLKDDTPTNKQQSLLCLEILQYWLIVTPTETAKKTEALHQFGLIKLAIMQLESQSLQIQ